jgi:Tfp pilus assembly protein PilV
MEKPMKTSANTGSRSATEKKRSESGTTLIETMIAAAVLIIGVLALVATMAVAAGDNWNRGDRATRTTEYAEDKMEQLVSLNFTDTATNTAVYPPTAAGGTGLTAGGGVTVGSPVTGYVDYVDNTGTQQATASLSSYIRQWSVSVNAGANLETITVTARALDVIGLTGAAPTVSLVCTKSAIQ